jgi:predicted extracellular nuclease
MSPGRRSSLSPQSVDIVLDRGLRSDTGDITERCPVGWFLDPAGQQESMIGIHRPRNHDCGGDSQLVTSIDQDGGQPGGNIRNVFLFNPVRVTFQDRGSADVDRTTTGTVVIGTRGRPTLTLSPGRIDPGNPAWTTSRKPLVGEFRFRGLPEFVIANHFNSKGGNTTADGRFQYPTRSSEVQRQQQALLVYNFVRELLKKNPLTQAVVIGDLNDYQFSPALRVLETGRADGKALPLLIDLIQTLPADERYTYVYQGISQVLDHRGPT